MHLTSVFWSLCCQRPQRCHADRLPAKTHLTHAINPQPQRPDRFVNFVKTIIFVKDLYRKRNQRRHWRTVLICLLVCASLLPAIDASYMLIKASVAQRLIDHSWRQAGTRPWPWADTMPVARLSIDKLKLDTIVLSGASGASLAFGPGMVNGSSSPGENGVTMIAAHRDTHFKSLAQIQIGHIIKLEDQNRQQHQYVVNHIDIADSRTDSLTSDADLPILVLVTCYPFDALIPGGPLRFVVEAQLLES